MPNNAGYGLTLSGSGSGAGALRVATRSDNSNPAVFTTFAELEAYTATSSGATDAAGINTSNVNTAQEVFALGTLVNNQVATLTAAFVRLNGAWVSIATNLVGTPGADGSDVTDLSNLSEYHVPMLNGDGELIDSGLRRLDSGIGDFEFDTTGIFPRESIQIGFSGVLSALGAVPMFRSFVTGRRGTFPFTYFARDTGSFRTVEVKSGTRERLEVQPISSEIMATSGTFQFTTTAAEVITKILFRAPPATDVNGLRLRFTVVGQTEPFYYYPTQTLWENTLGRNLPDTGNTPNEFELDLIDAPMFILGITNPNDVVTVNVEYAFSDGNVLGDTDSVPYIAIDRNVVTLTGMALIDEVINGVDTSISEGVLTTTLSRNNGTSVSDTVTLPTPVGGQVNTVVPGSGIAIDSADPINPVVSATTQRTDAQLLAYIRGAFVGGDGITLTDVDNTVVVSTTSVTPPAGPSSLFYGRSATSNPGTVDVATLTSIDPTDPQTVSTGLTAQGDYFIILTANTHDILSIRDTVLNQDVTNIFVSTSDVRTIASTTYDSYVVGPLNADVDEQYVLRFS